jgi:predicted DsbA family dithiol-disulfide isomerase
MLSLRFQNLSVSTTHKKLQQAQLLFESLNFDKSAMLQFHRSYYWGIDELPLLAKRLEQLNAEQSGHPFCLHQDQHQSTQHYLINDWQQLAQIRSQRYELDFYFNFQDPLSYIYLIATHNLTEHYQIKLNLRPIYLDNDSRQHNLHFSFYELIHLQELAESYNLHINPNYILSAQGLNHCFALFYIGLIQDQAATISKKILAAIWSDNKDLSYLTHLQPLLKDISYNNKQFKELLKQQAWHGIIEHNTNQWLQLDLPELPSFYLQGEKRISVCGAHRLWALEMALIERLNDQNH